MSDVHSTGALRAPTVRRNEGRFNLLSDEREAQLVVTFWADGSMHSISDTFPIDSEHDIWTEDPFDAVDVIENSLARYWISTSRDQENEKIALFRRDASAHRLAWLRLRATHLQEYAAKAAALARRAADDLADLEST
ncbi:hypothetical protein [Methylibium sp.]|uniref:hypothetical protein n=1 Tax=Methylibium sp. TaxID=2067992 RepID=UPI003BACBC9E